jgi:excisionase family DNA binding protein
MMTVLEASRRAGLSPDTIRRWIRTGRLPARNVSTHYLIAEADLLDILEEPTMLPLPAAWQRTITGDPMPNFVAMIRRSRVGH